MTDRSSRPINCDLREATATKGLASNPGPRSAIILRTGLVALARLLARQAALEQLDQARKENE